ncbi:hypothetical protein B0T21DRAFT_43078 [Apiosordaria backusii]|uniref:Uncharacterized protein n=1 Tax=Apiosordaria backusii TaxID=314023 RepID=A0AA40E607_9PEZI|nr:hypothetical protein B0T21DRAFT_43078 [Apiosordaria backusii]
MLPIWAHHIHEGHVLSSFDSHWEMDAVCIYLRYRQLNPLQLTKETLLSPQDQNGILARHPRCLLFCTSLARLCLLPLSLSCGGLHHPYLLQDTSQPPKMPDIEAIRKAIRAIERIKKSIDSAEQAYDSEAEALFAQLEQTARERGYEANTAGNAMTRLEPGSKKFLVADWISRTSDTLTVVDRAVDNAMTAASALPSESELSSLKTEVDDPQIGLWRLQAIEKTLQAAKMAAVRSHATINCGLIGVRRELETIHRNWDGIPWAIILDRHRREERQYRAELRVHTAASLLAGTTAASLLASLLASSTGASILESSTEASILESSTEAGILESSTEAGILESPTGASSLES